MSTDIVRGAYQLALIDPPWTYDDKCTAGARGAAYKYSVLGLDDLKRLDVPGLLAPRAAVALWVTAPLLAEGLACLAAWGLTYKTVLFCWVKTSGQRGMLIANSAGVEGLAWGMGNHTRSNVELVLLGLKGPSKRALGIPRASAAVHQVVVAPRGAHSAKPRAVRERLVELYGDVRRVELFARERVPNWDAVGNEIDGRDIRDVVGMRPQIS
jgi:N6-adenosine-specific RNA methylase IME4